MSSEALEKLRSRLRDADRNLLCALSNRACFPRHPRPVFPVEGRRRLVPPPLDEIWIAICPAGTATDAAPAEKANRDLVAALAERQRLACEASDAKAALHPGDFHAALAVGDREQLARLLEDLFAELQTLDFIRTAAPETAPELDPNLALLLWREYLLPWLRQTELDHLAAP